MDKNGSKHGWGNCPYCELFVCATKNGKTVRHGFIRVRKGYVRTAFPSIPSGTDGKPCSGSGKPILYWDKPKNEENKP